VDVRDPPLTPEILRQLCRVGVFVPDALLRITGSLTAAHLLAQLVFVSGLPETAERGGWTYCTRKKMKEKFFVSRREQETARKILKDRECTEEKRMGLPGKMHFRVNWRGLIYRGSQLAQNEPTRGPAWNRLDGLPRANKLADIEPTTRPKTSQHLIPESSTENTVKAAQRGSPNTGVSRGGGLPPNTDSAAAAFRAFGFEARFGAPFFQQCVVGRSKELQERNVIEVMEAVIQDLQDVGRKDIPPKWYHRKHALEAEAQKTPMETDKRASSNGRKATNLFSQEKLQSHIVESAALIKNPHQSLAQTGRGESWKSPNP